MSKIILIENLSFSLFHKTCFEGFSAQIPEGSRIAIIGRNGCGKTSLLNIFIGDQEATEGHISNIEDSVLGHVPQIVENHEKLSGGQRFNEALTDALCRNPDLLLLDEPTNHLDFSSRKTLIRMLNSFSGSLIVATHDQNLLEECIDTLWHIENGRITIFHGKYSDYMAERSLKRASITREMALLDRKRKKTQESLDREQQRASKSRARGIKNAKNKRVDKIAAQAMANNAQSSTGRIKRAIIEKRSSLSAALSDLKLPKVITPSFHFSEGYFGKGAIITLFDVSIGYSNQCILRGVSLSISFGERIAIYGDNGSGKSTLVKALLNREGVVVSGQLDRPTVGDIGYLDQHYDSLRVEMTPYAVVKEACSHWSDEEVRKHLATFLFMKNEEVNTTIDKLSGGERARLSLALIAAKTPKILILDEVSNNLDMETKEHVVQVLNAYKGTLIVISHESLFLEKINIQTFYECKNGSLINFI